MTTKQWELMENTRFLIKELTNIQNLYYDTLVDELPETKVGGETFLWDFIFNGEGDESFSDYLSRYNKTLNDIFDEHSN